MTPTDKDLAEFARLGLEYKLLDLSQIVAWGDEVIEMRDDPPTWALDLSMVGDTETAFSILRQMQWGRGSVTPYLAKQMLFHLAYQKWNRGKIDWRDIRLIFMDIDLPPNVEPATCHREYEVLSGTILALWEELDGGYVSEAEIIEVVNKFFRSYDPSSVPLPAWV